MVALNHSPDPLPPHSPDLRVIEGRGTDDARWLRSPELTRLQACDVGDWSTRFRRIWLIAPHPDDEILGLGGSLSRLAATGADLCIVSVTDGEASHPGSTEWPPVRLASARRLEMEHGLALLDIDADILRMGLPDGRIGAHRAELLRTLVEHVQQDDLLLVTCCFDGHPDHEACGEVTALVAEMTGATMHEYPVWMWHWATPDTAAIPWARARRLSMDADVVQRKREALRSFTSQIERDGPRDAILPPHVIERFLRPFEVVFM